MDLGNFKLKVELCELENVAWYITFQDFILTPQKPNFSISDDLFDDKEIMVDPLRSQKLFQPKKNLFHNILLSNRNIRKKKNHNNDYQPVQYFFLRKFPLEWPKKIDLFSL